MVSIYQYLRYGVLTLPIFVICILTILKYRSLMRPHELIHGLYLHLSFNAKADDLIVGVDGSGIKVRNRGEWMRQAWGIIRGWIKVVIPGDSEGNIVDIRVGNEDMDERKLGRGMLRKNGKNVKKAMMDGLHDCEDTFNLCKKLEIRIRKLK